jgi:hypothetical protein
VDKSTDVSAIKSLALVCRVVNTKPEDLFLGLLPVPNATAEVLYSKIKDFFYKYRVLGNGLPRISG